MNSVNLLTPASGQLARPPPSPPATITNSHQVLCPKKVAYREHACACVFVCLFYTADINYICMSGWKIHVYGDKKKSKPIHQYSDLY